MTLNDLKKVLSGPVLINLERIITPKLISLLYVLGLAAIGLWAINHFFFSFRFGFGNGVWGLLEIGVFGALALLLLRTAAEVLLIFFKKNEEVIASHNALKRLVSSPTLIEEVSEAIEDLAESDTPLQPTAQKSPAKSPQSAQATPKRRAPRRTAKRNPKTTKS